MYLLLMGPFGSNRGHHLDGFGAKKRNFDDFVAKKWSFGLLFVEKIKILRVPGHVCIYE